MPMSAVDSLKLFPVEARSHKHGCGLQLLLFKGEGTRERPGLNLQAKCERRVLSSYKANTLLLTSKNTRPAPVPHVTYLMS
eukprot:scaffold73280_cov21-Tisochrysis_lutea.AAC.1